MWNSFSNIEIRMSLSIDNSRVIDAYLVYKYACFNKPEQDLEISQTPLVEPPYIDIDACREYNESLEAFIELPLKDRVELITQTDQRFCVDYTIESHFVQLVHDIQFSYKGTGYADMSVPAINDIMNSFKRLDYENQAILFHFLDIYYNDQSDRVGYPFLENVDAFSYRIDFIASRFMETLCCYLNRGPAHSVGCDPAHSVLVAMWTWWYVEQDSYNGVHIIIGDDHQPEEEEDVLNMAFIAEEEGDDNVRRHIRWDIVDQNAEDSGYESE